MRTIFLGYIRCNNDKLTLPKFIEIRGIAVTHSRSNTTNELIDNWSNRPLILYYGLYTLGSHLLGDLFHHLLTRGSTCHSPIYLTFFSTGKGYDFPWGLFCRSRKVSNHRTLCASNNCLNYAPSKSNSTIGDNRNICLSGNLVTLDDGRKLRNTEPRNQSCCAH